MNFAVMARPHTLQPHQIDDDHVKELLREAETDWYGDAAFFGAMAHAPPVFQAIVSVFESFPQGDNITSELLELMRLKVAEIHQCAYCATVRTLEVRDAVARKEDAIFGDVDADELDEREYLAVRLAEQFSEDPHRITDEFFERLSTVFTESETIELLLFTSLEVGLDRFCIALELDTTEWSEYPDDLNYPLESPKPQTK